MKDAKLVSIVISNYNYGRFLPDAIESALAQTWPRTEVIVVDDGSTDDSRQVISRYERQIISVLKKNGGMASAQNAGFYASRGEVVIFLDSDDMLLASVAEQAVRFFAESNLVKVHWPIWETDALGNETGRIIPDRPLVEGNLLRRLIDQGPDACVGPLIHGNAWSRSFLERVFPIPEAEFRQHSDMYLLTLAPLFGEMKAIHQPQGYYRVHGANDYACRPVDEKNQRNLEMYRLRCRILKDYLQKAGIAADSARWERSPGYEWMLRRHLAGEEIKALVPEGASLILVDEQHWADRWGGGQVISGRCSIPFMEREGQYWGRPQDDETAIRELERLRGEGAIQCIVFAWPAFWWLEYYPKFADYLRSQFPCPINNERLVVFGLQGKAPLPTEPVNVGTANATKQIVRRFLPGRTQDVECSSMITSAPRRTRLYCVGAAKSGTKSIADCFRQSLRSAHEPESEQTIDAILAVAKGAMTRAALREYVHQRDGRLALEVDSSQLNCFFLAELVALFPDARFILTIRDPYSWLDSFINHQLNRPTTARWTRLRDLRFRAGELKHPAEEEPLRRRGLYTLDGYLSYWNTHNQYVCTAVAPEQRLVVRTDEISQRVGEIGQFAGLDPETADRTSSHSNKAETKHGLLGQLDADYLASKVHEHCRTLLQQFFPDISARNVQAIASTR